MFNGCERNTFFAYLVPNYALNGLILSESNYSSKFKHLLLHPALSKNAKKMFIFLYLHQINFARSQHKTIIIDPRTESITFVEPISETNSTNRMTTTKIEQISSIKFNSTTLVHLKRVSLLLKRLADNLDGATSTKD